MHGYDTLQGAWNETDRRWLDTPWQSCTRTTGGKTTYKLNLERIQFTRTEAIDPSTGFVQQLGTKFQCSLPKVLHGNNIVTLPLADVPSALDAVHALICETFPGAPHPSLMTPRRLDATDNRQLANEHAVAVCLKRLSSCSVGRTKPYIGQEGTVNWPGSRGGHTRKVYSKWRDTLEDEALGILRVESGAIGLKSIRADYQKALAASMAEGWTPLPHQLCADVQTVTVGHVMAVPGLPAAILGPLADAVDSIESEVAQMKVLEVVQKFVDAGFSYPNAYSKLGYAHAVQVAGWDGLMLTRQGRAKLKKEFAAAGVDPLEVEWGPVSGRVTKPRPADVVDRLVLAAQEAGEVAAEERPKFRLVRPNS